MNNPLEGWPTDDDRRLRDTPTIQPKTLEDVEELWDTVVEEPIVANGHIARKVERLKAIRNSILFLQDTEKEIKDEIAVFMKNHAVLVTHDGEELIAWRKASDSMRFDAKRFEREQPDIYKEYLKQQLGTRRFLIK
jgi:predicted phage-related endonuclease